MFIHRTQGVIQVVREEQFDLPTSQPLLTLLANSKEALESIGICESSISRLWPKENVAPMYRYCALVYPESVIGHLGAYENARRLPLGSNLTPAPVAFRWTIWGEIDWEKVDDFDNADKACFTGVCAQNELSELAGQAAESNDTLLAYWGLLHTEDRKRRGRQPRRNTALRLEPHSKRKQPSKLTMQPMLLSCPG